MAAALNNRGVRTARGGRWHVSNVKNLVNRLQRHFALFDGKNARQRVPPPEGGSIILRTVKGDGGDRDDSFARWLGTIYHGDIDENAEMIRSGYAKSYEDR